MDRRGFLKLGAQLAGATAVGSVAATQAAEGAWALETKRAASSEGRLERKNSVAAALGEEPPPTTNGLRRKCEHEAQHAMRVLAVKRSRAARP